MFQFNGKSPTKQGSKYSLALGQNVNISTLSHLFILLSGRTIFNQRYDVDKSQKSSPS